MFKNKNLIFLPWLLFALGISTLGFFAYRKNFDLETENYYAAELTHGTKMEQLRRGRAFKPLLSYRQEENGLRFSFPANFRKNPQFRGEIRLFRPSDAALDRTFPIQPDTALQQQVPAAELAPGFWKLQLAWSLGKTEYLLEDTLTLRP
ncbi:MAG: FixH family protein [Flavobacteriales bacterium]